MVASPVDFDASPDEDDDEDEGDEDPSALDAPSEPLSDEAFEPDPSDEDFFA